jgi:hypothetical protein
MTRVEQTAYDIGFDDGYATAHEYGISCATLAMNWVVGGGGPSTGWAYRVGCRDGQKKGGRVTR